ncbi:hypothetical protein AVEN_261305-1 [Araneus ventricosus]|uniref:Uncharacterized protein n=1 Tax=Araneus ventricosus TaxID=182803 RepID=A0A4Y2SK24_ARAVE|nr:hypothetical protein AVEN_261305-1 [Araneus ventricosus]
MEAPFKPHNRSLQSPGATVYTPPPAFKTGLPVPLSREIFTPPPLFCVVFAFLRKHRSLSPGYHFSFMAECAKWKTTFGYSHRRRVLVRGAKNGVKRSARECPA